MAIFKTLTEMRRAVVYEAGIKTGAGTTFRHTADDLDAEINSAFVEQQEESLLREHTFYLEESALINLSTGTRPTGENYTLIDWPTTAMDIGRVDVLVSNEWNKLDPVEWENLREVLPPLRSSGSQMPTHFSARQSFSVSAGAGAVGKIAIGPFSSTGQYKLSTLPKWTPLTNASHEFPFPSESAFRWVIWSVVGRVACRDPRGVTAQRYSISQKERAICESRMGRKRTAPSGGTMRRARSRWG